MPASATQDLGRRHSPGSVNLLRHWLSGRTFTAGDAGHSLAKPTFNTATLRATAMQRNAVARYRDRVNRHA